MSADYNQVEMRILADLADVKELKRAFVNKDDIHSITASQVFGVPLKKVDENLRRKAKTINFGIIYGITYGIICGIIYAITYGIIYWLQKRTSNRGR